MLLNFKSDTNSISSRKAVFYDCRLEPGLHKCSPDKDHQEHYTKQE